jgi:membrane associated rhomboid family serine protease
MKRKIPVVTFVILALNVIGLIYEYSVGEQMAVLKYGMYQGALEDGEYLRLLVSGFLHFGLYHFGSNMICLVLYGFDLEVKVGSGRYALIYFIALLGSSLLINFTGGNGIHAGASGAIWGLMTATLIFNVRHGLNAAYALRGIVLNLIYSFSANVSWQGHIGGGVSGLIAAAALCGNKEQSA